MIIFSFSLYGADPKYTEGMIVNAKQIPLRFPDAWVYIYIASDVPTNIRDRLAVLSQVKLIPVERTPGAANMFDRFMAIDLPECTVMFVRDADSRVHERDASCIEDFLASDKQLHIIRDHKHHSETKIMGGMWGCRKALFEKISIRSIVSQWHINPYRENDQQFLASLIYTPFNHVAMIHDPFQKLESADRITPFRVPVLNHLFVGQVHIFKNGVEGIEYTFGHV